MREGLSVTAANLTLEHTQYPRRELQSPASTERDYISQHATRVLRYCLSQQEEALQSSYLHDFSFSVSFVGQFLSQYSKFHSALVFSGLFSSVLPPW